MQTEAPRAVTLWPGSNKSRAARVIPRPQRVPVEVRYQRKPRKGTKRAKFLSLALRPEGVTRGELVRISSRSTVGAHEIRSIAEQYGYSFSHDRNADGELCYYLRRKNP
jgi:hypothetical protein